MGVDGTRGAGCGSWRGNPGLRGPTGGSRRGVQAVRAGQRPAGAHTGGGGAPPAPRGSSRRRPRRARLPPEGPERSLRGSGITKGARAPRKLLP